MSVRLFFQSVIRKLGLDYTEVNDHDVSEAYLQGTPLPSCNVPGCYEEMHQRKTTVYSYCKKHFDLYMKGMDICRVCKHPSCDVDIISSRKEYCIKHAPDDF